MAKKEATVQVVQGVVGDEPGEARAEANAGGFGRRVKAAAEQVVEALELPGAGFSESRFTELGGDLDYDGSRIIEKPSCIYEACILDRLKANHIREFPDTDVPQFNQEQILNESVEYLENENGNAIFAMCGWTGIPSNNAVASAIRKQSAELASTLWDNRKALMAGGAPIDVIWSDVLKIVLLCNSIAQLADPYQA